MSCIECSSTENLQIHHISYYPSKTEILCVDCHNKIHNHGTGNKFTQDVNKRKQELDDQIINKQQIRISMQIPLNMKEIIDSVVSTRVFGCQSEFIRGAIRDKIKIIRPKTILEEPIQMSEKQELDVLSVRITKSMTRIIDKFLNIDSHVTKSDFVRDAIRDKIKKEAPQLYLEMFEEEK